ncbi:MAG: GIY-YIG nuclease family protein [archaeon]
MQGCYALILNCLSNTRLPIGSLGEKNFSKGIYVYVGSAFGQNQSIESRVSRHAELAFSGKGSVHWHVDYILTSNNFDLLGFNEFPSENRNECKVADELMKKSDDVVFGFGCSDCSCNSHLFFFGN